MFRSKIVFFIINLFSKIRFTVSNNPVARARSNVIIDEDALEREVRDILSGKYIQRQIRASICSVPGDIDSNSKIDIHRKRSVFMKKIPLSSIGEREN